METIETTPATPARNAKPKRGNASNDAQRLAALAMLEDSYNRSARWFDAWRSAYNATGAEVKTPAQFFASVAQECAALEAQISAFHKNNADWIPVEPLGYAGMNARQITQALRGTLASKADLRSNAKNRSKARSAARK